LARVPIPLDSGDFSVMDRKVARFITSINDRSPFVRGLRSWYGGKQVAVEYERLARLGGTTKYSWFNLFDLALNGITSLSKLPLRLAIYAGGGISLLALSYGSFVVARRLLFGYPEGWGWSSAVTLIAFLNGLTLLLMGFIGEYIGHVFDASKQFPVYLVRESTNHGDGPRPRV
jgi:dolichol-phosphate mannosyltransferase